MKFHPEGIMKIKIISEIVSEKKLTWLPSLPNLNELVIYELRLSILTGGDQNNNINIIVKLNIIGF